MNKKYIKFNNIYNIFKKNNKIIKLILFKFNYIKNKINYIIKKLPGTKIKILNKIITKKIFSIINNKIKNFKNKYIIIKNKLIKKLIINNNNNNNNNIFKIIINISLTNKLIIYLVKTFINKCNYRIKIIKKIKKYININNININIINKIIKYYIFNNIIIVKYKINKINKYNFNNITFNKIKKYINKIYNAMMILNNSKNIIINKYKKYINYTIKTIKYNKIYYKDIIQEGYIGLNKAIEKYYNSNYYYNKNNNKKKKFNIYIRYWIKNYINKFINNKSKIIKTPNKIETIYSIDSYTKSNDTPYDSIELKENKIKINKYNKIYYIIIKSIKNINKRNKKIFIMRYGIYNNKIKTLKHIGKKFNLSKERIRQIIIKVINYIKEYNITKY